MKLFIFVLLTWIALSSAQGVVKPLIVATGYTAKPYYTTTTDGYILQAYRLSNNAKSYTNASVVLIQHGILCTSADWIVQGPGAALAYIMADAGYDVWLANSRGTEPSLAHTSFSTSSSDFWNYSFHELGKYDLPAFIDLALAKANKTSLYFIGQGYGSTAFFVMGSERPEYNKKVIRANILTPEAYMSNLQSPIFKILAPLTPIAVLFSNIFGYFNVISKPVATVIRGFCQIPGLNEVCVQGLFLLGGYDSDELNRAIVPKIFTNYPNGVSGKMFLHFGQVINSGKFQQYDNSPFGNSAPLYVLKKLTVPSVFWFGNNDFVVNPVDVQKTFSEIGNPIANNAISNPKFNHPDVVWGTHTAQTLYNKVLADIQAN